MSLIFLMFFVRLFLNKWFAIVIIIVACMLYDVITFKLTISDSLLERDHLLLHVYPKLRALCAEQGCDLDLHDLTWGLRDMMSSANPHVTQLCCNRLQHIVQLDPNAIIVVSTHFTITVSLHVLKYNNY